MYAMHRKVFCGCFFFAWCGVLCACLGWRREKVVGPPKILETKNRLICWPPSSTLAMVMGRVLGCSRKGLPRHVGRTGRAVAWESWQFDKMLGEHAKRNTGNTRHHDDGEVGLTRRHDVCQPPPLPPRQIDEYISSDESIRHPLRAGRGYGIRRAIIHTSHHVFQAYGSLDSYPDLQRCTEIYRKAPARTRIRPAVYVYALRVWDVMEESHDRQSGALAGLFASKGF
ncbi:hypothetical protein EDC01DRAFT_362166 [Geopyxis carbonaria]|nr:hypothetical protein EDC01DRAFT_362166 [Geopyxis carbonaria]